MLGKLEGHHSIASCEVCVVAETVVDGDALAYTVAVR